ncbi:MAG: peptidylprolyl isomerase [Bacteroidales bacterium]|nr:peptidylprolyl isomerase [Bacteroidales bacterium]
MGVIGNIRKHSWIAVVLVGVATIAFILGDLTKNRGGIPDMGTINGNTVTNQRFETLYEDMKSQVMRNQGLVSLTSEQEYQVRDQVWNQLLQEILMGEQYDKLGIRLSEAELSDMYGGEFIHPYLKQIFTDPQTGVYNKQAIQYYTENFDQLDTAAKQQWVEIEKVVTQDRKQQKFSTLIGQAMYMPKAMAAKIAELDAANSRVKVAAISYASIPDDQATPGEEDYKNYYEEHKAEYRVMDEMRQLDYVVFPIEPTQQDYAKIEEEVRNTWAEFQTMDTASSLDFGFFVNSESDQSYDSTWHHASDFYAPLDSVIMRTGAGTYIEPRVINNTWIMAKVQDIQMRPDSLRASAIWVMNNTAGGNVTRNPEQAKALADTVMEHLKKGLAFEQAVQQYSDNKQDNGDMGWALDGGYGFMNERVLETPVDGYFLMEHPQKYGYMIVKVTGKTAPQKKYRVAMIAKNIVASDATEKAAYNAANQFAGQNRSHAAMLQAAQKQNLQVRTDNVTLMSQSIGGVQNGREIVRWAFGSTNDAPEKGAVADQVFTADNMYVVAALKDVFEKGYATLDQVRPFMEQGVRIRKKGMLAVKKAAEAMKAHKDLASIASAMGTVVDTVSDVSFDGYYFGKFGMEPKVQATVALNASKKNMTVLGPVEGASGVYVMQIDSIATREALTPEGVQSQMRQSFMQKGQGVLSALRMRADIVDQRNKFF